MPDLPAYFKSFDLKQMLADHPIGAEFVPTFANISRDELRHRQNKLFMRCVQRAWEIPFYQRLWGQKGLESGDIRSLDDITTIPVFSKADLMTSLDVSPPFGDFGGVDFSDPDHAPAVMHTTSGTTGKPQVILFSAKTREIQNLLVARAYLFQGMRGSDRVHSVYGHGMVNAGHYMREAVIHFTNALFMSAGTGVETRSVQQIELMNRFKPTIIVGFVDYVKKLAYVAQDAGLEPGKDIPVRLISGHFGREDRNEISRLWGGAECFDWYGVGDTGIISGEGPDHNGMYVWEDAHYVEILDVEDGSEVQDGEHGDIVTTVLFKDDLYPMIRFNTHDVSAYHTTSNDTGLVFKRLQGIFGRSDNMVKLRGINVFPHGIAGVLLERPEFKGEYFCRAVRDESGRDDMIVMVEVEDLREELRRDFQALLKTRIGVEMEVTLHKPGALADLTEIEKRQKPKRLSDERFGT